MRRRASGDTDANGCAGDARRAGRERGGIRGVAKRIPARGHVGTRFRKPVRSKYTVGRRGGRTDLHGGTRCGTRGNGLCHGGCDAGVRSGSADAALAQLPPPTPVLNTLLAELRAVRTEPGSGGGGALTTLIPGARKKEWGVMVRGITMVLRARHSRAVWMDCPSSLDVRRRLLRGPQA